MNKIEFVNSITPQEIIAGLSEEEKQSIHPALVRLSSLFFRHYYFNKSDEIQNQILKIHEADRDSNLEELPPELLMLAYSYNRYLKSVPGPTAER